MSTFPWNCPFDKKSLEIRGKTKIDNIAIFRCSAGNVLRYFGVRKHFTEKITFAGNGVWTVTWKDNVNWPFFQSLQQAALHWHLQCWFASKLRFPQAALDVWHFLHETPKLLAQCICPSIFSSQLLNLLFASQSS